MLRYVANRRCVRYSDRYNAQHLASRSERERRRGQPCELCGDPMEQPCFDEVDGTLRGWLCHHCNIGLGQFRENRDRLQAAIDYLERNKHAF
jgi:hypothetical protein